MQYMLRAWDIYIIISLSFFSLISLSRHTEPYTEYKIIVIAFTLKYDGEPSDPVIQRTDISGPTEPRIINLTCHSQDAIYLQWRRPTSFYNSIDYYVINYRENSYTNWQQIQLNTSAAFAETAVSLFIQLDLINMSADGRERM
jgi:receptor-type tyrosine-protein phosphatase gamma